MGGLEKFCDSCGENLGKNKAIWKLHTCQGLKKYKCPKTLKCGKSFKTFDELKKHKRKCVTRSESDDQKFKICGEKILNGTNHQNICRGRKTKSNSKFSLTLKFIGCVPNCNCCIEAQRQKFNKEKGIFKKLAKSHFYLFNKFFGISETRVISKFVTENVLNNFILNSIMNMTNSDKGSKKFFFHLDFYFFE